MQHHLMKNFLFSLPNERTNEQPSTLLLVQVVVVVVAAAAAEESHTTSSPSFLYGRPLSCTRVAADPTNKNKTPRPHTTTTNNHASDAGSTKRPSSSIASSSLSDTHRRAPRHRPSSREPRLWRRPRRWHLASRNEQQHTPSNTVAAIEGPRWSFAHYAR